MNYFVSAIGTDSGKTIASAILALALEADYWKPVQAGYPTDTETIKSLTNGQVFCHPERYLLKTPASPHLAASIDKTTISLNDFQLPQTKNNLVIEGAGGLMVPLNDNDLVTSLAARFESRIILVSNNYLGSINHTLLSLEYLKNLNLRTLGIIFNGPPNQSTEDIILSKTDLPCLLKIPQLDKLDYEVLKETAVNLKQNLHELV